MKRSVDIYIVYTFVLLYGLVALGYAIMAKSPGPGIHALMLFISAIGLYYKKSWSQYIMYACTIPLTLVLIYNAIMLIKRQGWPYYPTVLESIIGLIPGTLFSVVSIYSCVVMFIYFRSARHRET